MEDKAIATQEEAKERGLTLDEARKSNKSYLAACGKCGGWTRSGGMSQYHDSEMGCICKGGRALPKQPAFETDPGKMAMKYKINDKVTWISGGTKNMTGVIFNRFEATSLIPENRYGIAFGKKERVTLIAESKITGLINDAPTSEE